jgi:predicted ATPase
VALFGKLKAPEEGAVRFAHQSALAHEVLADTYLAAGNKAAAASGYQAALEWCNRALNSKQPIDNEMRQTLNKEMAYLRRQMALVQ